MSHTHKDERDGAAHTSASDARRRARHVNAAMRLYEAVGRYGGKPAGHVAGCVLSERLFGVAAR